MIYIQYEKITDTKAKVVLQHFQPGILPPDMLANGVLVDSIPDANPPAGQFGVLYINPQDNTFSYDYLPIPLTQEQKVDAMHEQLMTADQKYKLLDLTTANLADVQAAKTAQIREFYYNTLKTGFNVTIGSSQYTFGWTTDDLSHMNATQKAIEKGFLTFPIQYADVHGNPVTIPDQATLDSIESEATKFMMAQHQQGLKLVGNVQLATTNTAVDAITWSAATY